MKPGTEVWKKRIDKWAIRTKTTKNGEKIFCGAITREHRQTSWRRDDLDKGVEQSLNTGPDQELVEGYKNLTVTGYMKNW